MLSELTYRLRSAFRSEAVESELEEELQFHLDLQTQKYVKEGLPPEMAARRARVELGGIDQMKEECRDQRGISLLSSFVQDLRFTLRIFAKNRVFTAIVVFSLALGIGMTSAIFSLVYAMLVDPFPYRDSPHIAAVTFYDQNGYQGTLNYPESGFLDLRHSLTSVDDAFGFKISSMTITHGLAEGVTAVRFSSNAFSFLGVPAILGRTFTAAEVPSPADPPSVVVLSHAFWRRHYGGNPAVVGKTLEFEHQPFTIIGIMPPRFSWGNADVYVPLKIERRGGPEIEFVARAKPGVSLESLSAEVDTLTHGLAETDPNLYPRGKFHMRALSLADWRLGSTRRTLVVLSVASGFLLLISCANVSILLFARATARQKEMAIRKSLGASVPRVIRQLLTESVALSLSGGILGLALGSCALSLILHLMPDYSIPRELLVQMNGPVMITTFVTCVLTGLLFGLMPALELSRQSLSEAMQDSGTGAAGAQHGSRARNVIVGAEIVLSMMLLVGTALAVHSLVALNQVRLGYDPKNVLVVHVPLAEGHYTTWQARSAVFEHILDDLASIPGVQYAAATPEAVPPRTGFRTTFEIAGQTNAAGSMLEVGLIGGDYFPSLRIPLLRGRLMTNMEIRDAGPEAVINEEMAQRFWIGGRDPIGARVHIPALKFNNGIVLNPPGRDQWFRVVGVVGNAVNEGLRKRLSPSVYVSYKLALTPHCAFMIRTAADPHAFIHVIRERIAAVAPDQIVTGAETLDEALDTYERALPLFLSALFSLFGGVALALAATGVYSVVAYSVARRTHELGIRMAMGARPGDVLRLVVGNAMRLVSTGLVIGIVASLALSRMLGGFLQDWDAHTPTPFVSVIFVLSLTAFLAAWIPARRATKIAPAVALRHN